MSEPTTVKGTLVLHYGKEKNNEIRRAAEIIKRGGLVAFPTETVYGLGADPGNDRALERIFAVKGRPAGKPLIMHIADFSQVAALAHEPPAEVAKLAGTFWPGPLTLVLKKRERISPLVTAGLPTVAIRMPAHPAALALIEECGFPVVAPSANLSGTPSPTEAAHVIEDFAGKIDAILTGGRCPIGIESTVLDLAGEKPVLLRPGSIGREELASCLQAPVLIAGGEESPASFHPSSRRRHYAPRAELILFRGFSSKVGEKMASVCHRLVGEGRKVGVLCTAENRGHFRQGLIRVLGRQAALQEVAASFYHALRELDRSGVDVILGEGLCEEDPLGLALMNRLQKAADRVVDVI
ncbi:MAG: threonylcarbamoyl-AMP synthase [Firmicutes bacterium]|jgi:L-threonylcarbamoyladenylate synthase|nr:threonylcarbamoyl-AMP synthase [Bacillota bacterium]